MSDQMFERFIPNIAQSYFITGIPGSGKTTLSLIFVKKWLGYMEIESDEELSLVRFSTLSDVVKLSRSANDRTSEDGVSARHQLQSLKDISLLVLDDIGTDRYTEYALETVNEFIDYRYQHQKQTLYTSNYTLEDLKSKYDERTASRITGMCGLANVVTMNPTDYRQNSLGTATTKTVQPQSHLEDSDDDDTRMKVKQPVINWKRPSIEAWKYVMTEYKQTKPMLVEFVNQIILQTKQPMSWTVYIAANRMYIKYLATLA